MYILKYYLFPGLRNTAAETKYSLRADMAQRGLDQCADATI